MADEEERIKSEKLAAAKKRVAQLQKQKKKAASKKASTSETPKDTDVAESSSTPPPPPVEGGEGEGEAGEKEKSDEAPSPQPETSTSTETPIRPEEEETERMPDAPTSPAPLEDEQGGASANANRPDTPRAGHTRQPSLSVQSKMRSSSFRKSSVSQGSAASTSPAATAATASLKSPSLPPLSADGEYIQEVYRKQSARIEELERENKRLEKEVEEVSGRWKKTEDQLEDLREVGVDVAELKDKLQQAEKRAEGVDELKAEIASLQRQNSHLQARTHRNTTGGSAPGTSETPPSDLMQQLESKSAAMEAMELEISNLRAQISAQSTHETQITALEEKLARTESDLEKSQRELTDTKNALTRASEKAVKEGVGKTSTETLIKSLQREIEELKQDKSEAEKKIETLDKKLQTLSTLHKESETRHQTRLRESEKTEQEAAALRIKLAATENDNLRLKDELETLKRRHACGGEGGGADDDALDELEDEERSRLQRRIRELEGENFDLRRGVWQEKRHELLVQDTGVAPDYTANQTAANAFDDVDLVGGTPEHARRRSMAQKHHQQQHSSFSTVLSSGIAAFTGGTPFYGARTRTASNQPQPQNAPATRGSLELLSEENIDYEFDEGEFARAQAEEEARKRVEWVREIKRQLRDWKGWRLDLVDSRAGAEGAGVGMGEIFEV